jgi:hypothetical protein
MAMIRRSLSVVLIAALGQAALCQDVTFDKSHLSSVASAKETEVTLTITDTGVLIKGKKKSDIDLSIPFSAIDSLSYEHAERHRVGEGAAVMVVSLGIGAVVMATKTKSHWLDIAYHEGNDAHSLVLHLDKSEYESVLGTLEHKSGKPVARLDAKSSAMNPTAESRDMDEVVPYGLPAVAAALKPAMEDMGCHVRKSSATRIECHRDRSKGGGVERTGVGGEKVTAELNEQDQGTRVLISTEKGFEGHVYKKNWSTPIYQEMLKTLQKPASEAKTHVN